MKKNDLHILFTVTVPWKCVGVRYVKGVCSLVGVSYGKGKSSNSIQSQVCACIKFIRC